MSYLGAQPAPLATQLDDNVVNTNNIVAGAVETTDIANAAVTSDKLASGAAASNLGNYVSTVNGSTGAVTVQPTLVSGTTIKTVNSTSLLGSGDVAVQATLVSGTNIKTINSTSLLGSGDITVGASTSFNAVGTYVWGYVVSSGSGQINSGGTVSAGSSYWQLRSINFGQDGNITPGYGNQQNNLSGTWANMSAYMTAAGQNFWWVGLFVRVS